MKEQVMVYEVKSKANINVDKLFSPDRKYFYWNDKAFKNLEIGDFVFVVNTYGKKVFFSKLDLINIPVTFKGKETYFSDNGITYIVSGKYNSFIRLRIIEEIDTVKNWSWKSLGTGEFTYLNGSRISKKTGSNRITSAESIAIS